MTNCVYGSTNLSTLGENCSNKMATPAPMPTPSAAESTCLLFDFVIEAVLMGLLCIFGFTGNTLSILCLLRDKSKTATPFLLVSLEVADTLFLVTVLVLRVLTSIYTFTGWPEALMKYFPYFGTYMWPCALIAEMATIYLTLLVTINRYISVCRPYEVSNLCSLQHSRKHVIILTTISILYNLPRFFEYKVVTFVNKLSNKTETISLPSKLAGNIYYQIIYSNIFYFLVMFLIPLISLVILNFKLVKALRKAKKKRSLLCSKARRSSTQKLNRSENDITLVLIVVVVVFVICQTPALITQSLFSFLEGDTRGCPGAFFYYERISDLLVVVNSSTNFIVYCLCSRKFRQIFVELLCKKKLHSPECTEASMATTPICYTKENHHNNTLTVDPPNSPNSTEVSTM